MYSALKDDNILNISNINYTNYIGSLSNFENYIFSKSRYYKVSSLDNFYKITNNSYRFEFLLKRDAYSWYEIYENLSTEDKEEVIAVFSELNLYEFNDDNIASDIKKWSVTDFFISLNVLNKYQFAITTVDIDNFSNKNKTFNHVNNNYPLDAAQKSLILYLMGNHKWSDIHTDNKKDIFDFFGDKYSVKDVGAILEMLGYEVKYNKDGSLTAYW